MEKKLTNEQLDTLLQFSNGLYSGFTNGIFNPFTQNQNLLRLNNSPSKPTYEKLLKALESVPYDYGSLSSYSEFMQVWDTMYAKTLRYFEGLLAFDLSYTCKNIKNPSDYKSKEYLDDVKRVNKFLDNFDYKSEFRKVVKEIMRSEVCFTWFRDSKEINEPIDIDEDGKIKKIEKFGLQIMPQKYCLLTGYFDCGQLLYDFDMNYFLNASVDINLFAPVLKKRFREVFTNDKLNYNPSAQLDYHNGNFTNYTQTSPIDGAYAFKFDTSNFRQVPPLSNLMKACMNNDEIEALQKDKNMISAYMILAGEFQLLNTEKSGNKANQFAIDPKVVGQLLSLVSQGINNNVNLTPLPLKDIHGWQYVDHNSDMSIKQYSNVASQGASASTLIYTTDKMAQFELENAIYADYNFMKPLYDQFAQFMNFYVNRKTKKYKFDFCFDGLDRQWDREKRQTALRNYADKGIVMDATMWASALGMKPQAFMRSLESAHNSNFVDNLTLMLNANTMKNSGADNGRPELDVTERSDKTEEVEDYIK